MIHWIYNIYFSLSLNTVECIVIFMTFPSKLRITFRYIWCPDVSIIISKPVGIWVERLQGASQIYRVKRPERKVVSNLSESAMRPSDLAGARSIFFLNFFFSQFFIYFKCYFNLWIWRLKESDWRFVLHLCNLLAKDRYICQ